MNVECLFLLQLFFFYGNQQDDDDRQANKQISVQCVKKYNNKQ